MGDSVVSKSKNRHEQRLWIKRHLDDLPPTYNAMSVLSSLEWDEIETNLPKKFSKKSLISIVEAIQEAQPLKYKLTKAEQIAKKYKIDILFLPPYSPELNCIELLWSSVKRKMAAEWTGTETVQEIETRLREFLRSEGESTKCLKRYSHCEINEIQLQQELSDKDDFGDYNGSETEDDFEADAISEDSE